MGADGNRCVARHVAGWGAVGAARYRTAHNRRGALPGRHAASAVHGSPERSLAYLGKNVPKTASVGPRFDTFLPEKMVDLLVGRRISATTTSAGLSVPSTRPRARRISRRCSMSCEPVTATKACPGQIPRAPRGGRRQIDRLERGECSFRMSASVVKAVYRNDNTVCRTVCCRKVSDEVVGNPSLYGPYARRHT